jgi:Tfp pilus assembly protein PilN
VLDTRRALVRTDVERSALERPVRALRRLRQRQATLRRRLAVIERLEARGREPVVLLGALATAAPARLWLTELTLVDGRLRLAGLAADERIIADFIARLRGVGILGAIDLEEAGRDDRATPSPRRFVIGGRLGAAR